MNVRMGERTEKWTMPAPEQRAEEAAYDGAIASIDAELGLLFEELDRRGILDRTITVIVADHGEMFGEHGLFSHGHSLYRQLLNVPLVIVYPPSVPAGTQVDHDVTLRDLPATILALAGARVHRTPGTALLPFDSSRTYSPILAELRPAPGLKDRYPGSRGVMHSVVASGYQYIRDGVGAEELFALTDTMQAFNLSGEPEVQSVLATLRAALDTTRRAQVSGSVVGPKRDAAQDVGKG
jgi:arylsulfatase A-like enzyme